MNDRKKELYQKYEDALFGLALAELQEQELERLEQTPISDEEQEEMDAFFAATESRTLQRIYEKFDEQQQSTNLIRRRPARLGIMAAAVLVLLFVGLTAAVATVQPLRARVLEFLQSREDEYTQLQIRDPEAPRLDVPEGWNGEYYPTYIPDRLTLRRVDENITTATYDNENLWVSIRECTNLDIEMFYDTEDSDTRQVEVLDQIGTISEKNGVTAIWWAINDRYFVIYGTLPPDVAIAIAESVIPIQ
ncbi:DUF4367 domain-containing protein [Eubacteriales bacterium OttesenSCG-928-N13]|nr:DUF4367 domain-containing protein [Eubacteriales bacterium OttesenSCG-928-N13]